MDAVEEDGAKPFYGGKKGKRKLKLCQRGQKKYMERREWALPKKNPKSLIS